MFVVEDLNLLRVLSNSSVLVHQTQGSQFEINPNFEKKMQFRNSRATSVFELNCKGWDPGAALSFWLFFFDIDSQKPRSFHPILVRYQKPAWLIISTSHMQANWTTSSGKLHSKATRQRWKEQSMQYNLSILFNYTKHDDLNVAYFFYDI